MSLNSIQYHWTGHLGCKVVIHPKKWRNSHFPAAEFQLISVRPQQKKQTLHLQRNKHNVDYLSPNVEDLFTAINNCPSYHLEHCTLKICLCLSALMPRWTIASTVSWKQSSIKHLTDSSYKYVQNRGQDCFQTEENEINPQLFFHNLEAMQNIGHEASSIPFSVCLWPLSSSEKQQALSFCI